MTPFRPDVEGLRAVAIAIVVLAHAEIGFGAGGFVGVDVFFVISGFLITQPLVAELDRTGAVVGGALLRAPRQAADAAGADRRSPRSWSRRGCCSSPVEAEAIADDVVAAGAYAMNWHLSAEAVDYFASGARDQPLDHLWSLAVEEQFYIVWPWLLVALGVARGVLLGGGARRDRGAARSLYACRQRAASAPEAAYYSAFARAWELGLGALAAVLLAGRSAGAAHRGRARLARLGRDRVRDGRVRRGDAVPRPGRRWCRRSARPR